MNKIKILSQQLINQIAAGEVVERPSSIVKEMVENSIDAESSEITVELLNSGKDSIIVKDNGNGIDAEDLELTFASHATSKISETEDLFSITTLGFRGEAIASISSVSKTTICTKNRDAESAYKISSDFGVLQKKEKTAHNTGTTITVENLFKNVPARLKFLKNNQTELNHSIAIINDYAIAYPSISFRLYNNKKELFFYPKTHSMEQRLGKVFSDDIEWLKKEKTMDYLCGSVFVSPASISTTSKKNIKIFVNGRSIKDKLVYAAIMKAFEENLSETVNPILVLFINMDPAFVDVNVSPGKTEVRFRDEAMVFAFVREIVREAVLNNKEKQEALPSYREYAVNIFNPVPQKQTYTSPATASHQLYLNETGNIQPKLDLNSQTSGQYRIIGQFKGQYLLIENSSSLTLIDQHAAHERILFEKFSKELSSNSESQKLLIPEIIEISISEKEFFDNACTVLNKMGFEINFFKEENNKAIYTIHATPRILNDISMKDFFAEMLKTETTDIKTVARIAARISCHSAIRGSRRLTDIEAMDLINKLEDCEFPYTCPHGRPVKIEFTLDEIERLFSRK